MQMRNVLKGQPIGLWIVALWAIAHVVPGVVLAADTGGTKAVLLWLLIVGEIVLAGGLVMGWRLFRYLAVAQLVVHVLIFSTIGWAFTFVAFAWGLHGNEVPILAAVGVYVLFTAWAFIYLFSPSVEDHFAATLGTA
jgi:hypothetical protein